MDLLSFLQWPAMVVTVGAAWLVSSTGRRKRHWGLHAQAYALIALQFCLAAMNMRGARKTETAAEEAGASAKG